MGEYDRYIDVLIRLSHGKLEPELIRMQLENLCEEFKLDPEDATKLIARKEGLAVAVFEPYSQDWKEFHFCQGCGNRASPNCFDCLMIPSDYKPIEQQKTEKRVGIIGKDYAYPCPKCNSEHTHLMPDNISYCEDCGNHFDTIWKIYHYSNFCPYYDYAEGSNDGCLYNGHERPMMCDPDLCPIKVK